VFSRFLSGKAGGPDQEVLGEQSINEISLAKMKLNFFLQNINRKF